MRPKATQIAYALGGSWYTWAPHNIYEPVHAIRFEDGSVWDYFNGWRNVPCEPQPLGDQTTSEPKDPSSEWLLQMAGISFEQLEAISLALQKISQKLGTSFSLSLSVGSGQLNFYSKADTPTSAVDVTVLTKEEAERFAKNRLVPKPSP